MKKTLVVALMALTAATGMFAQGGPGDGRRGDRTPLTAEQRIDRRVQMLTTLLTLDASQQAQAKTIFTNEQTEAEALRAKMETAQEAFRDAVKGSASDSQIDQLAASLGTLHGQSLALHAKAQAKFRSILNADQKTKLDTVRGGFGRGPAMGNGPMGGPGRMRGPRN